MADKTRVRHTHEQRLGLGNGEYVAGNSPDLNSKRVDSETVQRLLSLKEWFKAELEVQLRDNQMHGIRFLIDKATNELFDKLGKII
jgi:hypothetical protein